MLRDHFDGFINVLMLLSRNVEIMKFPGNSMDLCPGSRPYDLTFHQVISAVSQLAFSSVLVYSHTRYTSSVGAQVLFQPRERIEVFSMRSRNCPFIESASGETREDSVRLYIPACISRSQVLKY